MYSTLSLRSFPKHCLWNSFDIGLIDDGPLSFQGRSPSVSSFFAPPPPPPFHAIDGVIVLGFVPASCLKLLNTSYLLRCETLLMVALLASLMWLLCSPVCLFGHFPWRRNVQGSTSTGTFEDGRRILTHGQTYTPSIAFWHLPPNSAIFGYATEGALFFSFFKSLRSCPATRSAPPERFRVLIWL